MTQKVVLMTQKVVLMTQKVVLAKNTPLINPLFKGFTALSKKICKQYKVYKLINLLLTREIISQKVAFISQKVPLKCHKPFKERAKIAR